MVSNASGLVNATTSNIITAKYNYWGNGSGPSGSGPGTGQSVTAGVLYEPWLTAPYSLPNYFNSSSITNRVFNPSLSIVTTVNFGSALSGDWTFNVLNSGGNTIRSFAGTGLSGSVVWDGKDGAGATQTNGTYTFQISSTTSQNEIATPIKGTLIIDTNRLLTMSGVLLTPGYLSPNNDAVQDTTRLTATANYDDATWNLDIKNSSGTMVRSFTTQGNGFSYTWDGKDSNGAVQADGTYTFQLVTNDGTGTANNSQNAILDSTFPQALISSPQENTLFSNVYNNGNAVVPVIGSATDSYLTSWNLSYSPTGGSWTTVTTGASVVTNSTFTTWDSLGVANGTYSFRLQASDRAGNLTTTIRNITVGNFRASEAAYEVDRRTSGFVTYSSIIPFTLSETITIKNKTGQVIKTIVRPGRNQGTYYDSWNFTNDAGASLPDGPYFYTTTVTDGTSTMLWDTSNVSISPGVASCGDSLRNDAFDPFNNGFMSYLILSCFSGPSIVTISTSEIWPGPPCGDTRTYCIWNGEYVDRGSGNHFIRFVGVDDTNTLRPFITSHIARVPSSTNTVLAYGTKPTITNIAASPPVHAPLRGNQTVSFTLGTFQNQPVTITATYFNHAGGSIVRTITLNNVLPGTVSVPWDGKSDDGNYVVTGDYYVIKVTATDSIGNAVSEKLLTTVNY